LRNLPLNGDVDFLAASEQGPVQPRACNLYTASLQVLRQHPPADSPLQHSSSRCSRMVFILIFTLLSPIILVIFVIFQEWTALLQDVTPRGQGIVVEHDLPEVGAVGRQGPGQD